MASQFDFTSRGAPAKAELHSPGAAAGTLALVVVVHGIQGLVAPWDGMIRGYAEALAADGAAALIPDYLSGTGGDLSPTPANLGAWQALLSDAIDAGAAASGIGRDRIGLLGFSLGGYLCLRLRDKARVIVEYFAPDFHDIGTAGPLEAAQIHHGTADGFPFTDFSNAGRIKSVLEAEGTPTTLFAYEGATHGFAGQDQPDADAHRLSKERTLAFFRETFGASTSVRA